jgi:NTE family protein
MIHEINKLVFSGGGVKGLVYIGVLKRIEELIVERNKEESSVDFDEFKCKIPKFNINTICSVSVGSMFALIYLLKYSYVEILEEILKKNFKKLKDIKVLNFVSTYGLDSGSGIIKWLETLMIKKGINPSITLSEFYKLTNVDFQIMATNLNKYCYKKFNYKESPDLRVLDAIRMSISIPFIFSAVNYDNNIYVDGNLIDNYPIKEFDNLDNLLGFKIVNNADVNNVNKNINDLESYILNIFKCYVSQKEKSTVKDEYKRCTVYINVENINSINIDITVEEKYKLIEIGYKSVSDFFSECQNMN